MRPGLFISVRHQEKRAAGEAGLSAQAQIQSEAPERERERERERGRTECADADPECGCEGQDVARAPNLK